MTKPRRELRTGAITAIAAALLFLHPSMPSIVVVAASEDHREIAIESFADSTIAHRVVAGGTAPSSASGGGGRIAALFDRREEVSSAIKRTEMAPPFPRERSTDAKEEASHASSGEMNDPIAMSGESAIESNDGDGEFDGGGASSASNRAEATAAVSFLEESTGAEKKEASSEILVQNFDDPPLTWPSKNDGPIVSGESTGAAKIKDATSPSFLEESLGTNGEEESKPKSEIPIKFFDDPSSLAGSSENDPVAGGESARTVGINGEAPPLPKDSAEMEEKAPPASAIIASPATTLSRQGSDNDPVTGDESAGAFVEAKNEASDFRGGEEVSSSPANSDDAGTTAPPSFPKKERGSTADAVPPNNNNVRVGKSASSQASEGSTNLLATGGAVGFAAFLSFAILNHVGPRRDSYALVQVPASITVV